MTSKAKFTAKKSITIHASIAKVWDALTNPSLIKQYFFGVDVFTNWTVGSPILYRGVWQGKAFEDKGTILKIEPERRLVCNYWSSFSGLPDLSENYQKVTYTLSHTKEGIHLTITQDNIPTEESKNHSEKNWSMVLESLKKLVEK